MRLRLTTVSIGTFEPRKPYAQDEPVVNHLVEKNICIYLLNDMTFRAGLPLLLIVTVNTFD
jgi:hypothetical protein